VTSRTTRQEPASTAIDQFLEQFFFRHPVDATSAGMRLHDHELPDWSREAREDELDEFEALQVALDDAFDPAADDAALAGSVDAVDAELARRSMDVRQLEFESGFFHDRNPALWTREALMGVLMLMRQPPTPLEDALASIAMRLHEVPTFLSDLQTTVTDPAPMAWRVRALQDVDAAEALLRTHVANWLTAHGADEASTEWVLTAATVAAEAFAEVGAWLRAMPDGDASRMAFGEEALTVLLDRAHAVLETPAQLLQRASESLTEAQERLEELATATAGSADAMQLALDEDAPPASALLAALEESWEAGRTFAEEHDVVEWGDWPRRFLSAAPWLEDMAQRLALPLYHSPSPYELPAVHTSYASRVDASGTPLRQSDITLDVALADAGLGRQVLHWHAAERSLSKLGRIAALDGASRPAMLLGATLADGWASYVVDVAEEFGFLSPHEQGAAQQRRVRGLVQAVVDLRLHTGEWQYEDAVDFVVTDAGLPRARAEQLVTTLSMSPGRGVASWLGAQVIRLGRDAILAQSGTTFSLRRYHDALLSRGAIPAPLAVRLSSLLF
jgi:hypothetical protein